MDDRVVQFIAGLRAAGVRVSLAESQDAFRAVAHMGVMDREHFKAALRTTLVKERNDQPLFDKLFPLFFGSGGPPFIPPDAALSPEDQKKLEAAMRALAGELSRLLEMLASGRPPTQEEMERMGRQAGADRGQRPEQQQWLTREMLRRMGLESLAEQIEKLLEELARLGMTPEGQQAVLQLIAANRDALAEQVAQFVGQNIAREMSEQQPQKMDGNDLMQRPFNDLSQAEARALRHLVARLAARLRTRAARRQRKGDGTTLDAKTTRRANLQTGGVPFDVRFKKKHLKPKFALICDVSTSKRPPAGFRLRLLYAMRDRVGKPRLLRFTATLREIAAQ